MFEDNPKDALKGHARGREDAQFALAQATSLGMPAGRPIYFGVDFDASPNPAATDSYFDGLAEILGHEGCGPYGGIAVVSRQLNRGFKWAWQTYAWSRNQLDGRAQIYQYSNGHSIGAAPRSTTTMRSTRTSASGGESPAGCRPTSRPARPIRTTICGFPVSRCRGTARFCTSGGSSRSTTATAPRRTWAPTGRCWTSFVATSPRHASASGTCRTTTLRPAGATRSRLGTSTTAAGAGSSC
ncbi:MAG: glycoside hydrolase domain-containing protein [Solirubrobacteraceae bacterium]